MGCLDPADQARLEALRLSDSFVDGALCQLERILASQKFVRLQQHARDFLGYIVGMKLLGQADQIKETTIAMAVFGESADFDPLENSKVRVAGSDLRQRLAEYCKHEGQNDPMEITIPVNTYVPDIRDLRASVAVSAFDNWHPNGDQDHLRSTISAEMAYLLNRAGWVEATAVDTIKFALGQPRYALRGSFETREGLLRINVSLGNLATGHIVCSRSFMGPREDALKLTREIADTLLKALRRAVDSDHALPNAARTRVS